MTVTPMTLDAATTLGSGVSFDGAGNLFKATVYSNTAGTSAVNQVENLYNGFGQLTTQYQEHAGTVNTGSSQKVQYTFDQAAGGVNESRLRGTVYPDGRTVDNAYGTLQMSVSLSEPGGGSTTVTGTTSSAHGLQAGDRITISGASPAGYDGTYTIATVPTSTTFTYTDVAGLGTATGSNITFSRPGQTPISTITKSGSPATTATVTTAADHDLVTGDKVQIEGASDPLYDGIFTITVTGATTFTYTMSSPPSANASLTDATVSLYTLDTAISRVSGLQDHAAVGSVDSAGQLLEGYAYLGLDTIVQRNRPQTGVNLTYEASDSNATSNPTNDGGDIYTGLDRFGRIVDQNWVKDSTGVSTDRWQYGYDAASNVLYKNNLLSPSNSELYHANSAASGDNSTAYDPLNRLQAFRRGTLTVSASHYNGTTGLDTVTTGNLNSNADHTQSYSLDALGNQTSVTTDGTAAGNTVNSRNQKTNVNGTAVTFDNNGNALTGVGGAGTLTYDAWGDEITSATCSTSRTYDALGRMVISTAPDNFSGSPITKQHDLYYDARWQELQDKATWTASGCGCGCCCTSHSDEEQYAWGKGYVDDLVLRDRNPDSAGFTRLYVQQDANYNVTAITNTSGTVQERFVFTPYGQETTLTSAWATGPSSFGQFSTDSNAWIYGFQGWRYDSGTGFYTIRNRDYDVIFGWVGADPTVYSDGMNPYQVEGSNPVGSVDPSGLSWLDDAISAVDQASAAFAKTAYKTHVANAIIQDYSFRLNLLLTFINLQASLADTDDACKKWVAEDKKTYEDMIGETISILISTNTKSNVLPNDVSGVLKDSAFIAERIGQGSHLVEHFIVGSQWYSEARMSSNMARWGEAVRAGGNAGMLGKGFGAGAGALDIASGVANFADGNPEEGAEGVGLGTLSILTLEFPPGAAVVGIAGVGSHLIKKHYENMSNDALVSVCLKAHEAFFSGKFEANWSK